VRKQLKSSADEKQYTNRAGTPSDSSNFSSAFFSERFDMHIVIILCLTVTPTSFFGA